MLSKGDLDKIRARVNGATPGPWAWESTGEKCNSWSMGTVYPDHVGQIVEEYDEETQRYREKPEVVDHIASGGDGANLVDPDFIAHARSDVPALLDEIERLHAELQRVQGERNELRKQRDMALSLIRSLEAEVATLLDDCNAATQALTQAREAHRYDLDRLWRERARAEKERDAWRELAVAERKRHELDVALDDIGLVGPDVNDAALAAAGAEVDAARAKLLSLGLDPATGRRVEDAPQNKPPCANELLITVEGGYDPRPYELAVKRQPSVSVEEFADGITSGGYRMGLRDEIARRMAPPQGGGLLEPATAGAGRSAAGTDQETCPRCRLRDCSPECIAQEERENETYAGPWPKKYA